MVTVELQDVQAAAKWIRENDARDAAEASGILGISRARLSQMMSDKEIAGRKFGGRVWIPKAEIDKHVIDPGEIRVGRPRSGKPKSGQRR